MKNGQRESKEQTQEQRRAKPRGFACCFLGAANRPRLFMEMQSGQSESFIIVTKKMRAKQHGENSLLQCG